MIDCQNLVALQQPVSANNVFSCYPTKRVSDEESRVSTDSDPYLDSEEEEMEADVEDYRSTYSTFSAILIRRLQAFKEEQARKEDAMACEGVNVRPPLLTTADDSYTAKMERVFRWTRSVSAPASEASSDRDYSPPPEPRKRRLSDASVSNDANAKRVRTADGPSPAAPGSPLLPPVSHMYHHQYTLTHTNIRPMVYLFRSKVPRRVHSRPASDHVCTACDTFFASPQRLQRHGHGACSPDACRAAVKYGLE